MSIDQAISKSSDPLTIFIVKEALFCTVYEESAWRFSGLIRSYKPIKKTVKKLRKDVVSIGFPVSQLPAILQEAIEKGFTVESEEPGSVSILVSAEPECTFVSWKEKTALFIPGAKIQAGLASVVTGVNEPSVDYSSVVQAIESFSIADHTPMQTMVFLMEMQNKIKLVRKMPE